MCGDVTVVRAAVIPFHFLQHDGEVSLPELHRKTLYSTSEFLSVTQLVHCVFNDVDVQHAVVVFVPPVDGDILWQRLIEAAAQQDVTASQTLDFLLTEHSV